MTTDQQCHAQFTHQEVRDLAWSCLSPPLLAHLPESDAGIWTSRDRQRDLEWFAWLDRHPTALQTALAQTKSTRLGIYFENLWRFYWQHHPEAELLAHNLQLQAPQTAAGPGATRGAFDFLLRAHGDFWHIETAVKFYLGVPDDSNGTQASRWHQWLGPKCNDRPDLKLNRLRAHQLPLSRDVAAQATLTQLAGAPVHWQRALCLQGYLFYPAHGNIAPPLHAHPRHLRGDWWHLTDFLQAQPGHQWLILPRPRWLAPAQSADLHELFAGRTLADTLAHWVGEQGRPQLLAAMHREGDTWVEQTRCFIVPDHWPWTATPSRNT